MSDPVSRDVGRRLRAIRRQQGLSLDDVEAMSEGRWSSSAIGAYERGYRTLSIERLRALADFYGVPMSVLLTPVPKKESDQFEKVMIDLEALASAEGDLDPMKRLVRSIQIQRGDFNGKVLTIRGTDIKNLSLLYGLTEAEMYEKLFEAGVIVPAEESLETAEITGERGDESD